MVNVLCLNYYKSSFAARNNTERRLKDSKKDKWNVREYREYSMSFDTRSPFIICYAYQ